VPDLDVLLFTVDVRLARRAAAAGLAGFVVDWEDRRSSTDRTLGISDEPDTVEDLERIASVDGVRIVCRINPVGSHTAREVDAAVERGATDLLVPMVDTPHDVARVVALADGRVRVGVMIETVTACDNAAEIAREPADFVYVGLLDLALSRAERNVFGPLADGTAERLRSVFATPRFGIGGVTVVDGGAPVPCRVLLGELARLDTDIAFARRSFKRDTADRDLSLEHDRLRSAWRELRQRTPAAVEADHRDFVARFGLSVPR
jgi:hypothetical protein